MKNDLKKLPLVLTVLFFAVLLLPQILSPILVSLEDTRKENRNLEPFPTKFKWRRNFAELEAWYNDRIPFRANLLAVSRAFSKFMFPENHQRLIHGRDDFYFYAPKNKEENTYDQYAGLRSPRTFEIAEVLEDIQKIMHSARKNNCKLFFFIPPNKIDVYPDKLPEKRNAAFSPDGWPEKLNAAVKKELNDFPFYYVRNEMRKYRSCVKYPLYYPADNHWNYVGGYCGMKLMLEKSGLPWPSSWPIPEKAEFVLAPHKAFEELLPMADYNIERKNLPDHLVKGFSLHPGKTTWINGDRHYITENSNAPDSREVVIFRDSFMLAMAPYVSAYFRKVHFYWQRFDHRIVDSIKPDLLIVESIARYVYTL